MICEHVADIKHGRSRSYTLVEHVEKTNHLIFIEEAKVIAKISHFHHHRLREALEIEKGNVNFNRDDGWNISRCSILALYS